MYILHAGLVDLIVAEGNSEEACLIRGDLRFLQVSQRHPARVHVPVIFSPRLARTAKSQHHQIKCWRAFHQPEVTIRFRPRQALQRRFTWLQLRARSNTDRLEVCCGVSSCRVVANLPDCSLPFVPSPRSGCDNIAAPTRESIMKNPRK